MELHSLGLVLVWAGLSADEFAALDQYPLDCLDHLVVSTVINQLEIKHRSDSPDNDRPVRWWCRDLQPVAFVVQRVVPPLASSARRDVGVGTVSTGDEPALPKGESGPFGRVAVSVREDGVDLLRDPQSGEGPLGIRAGQRDQADEQCGGTRLASRGDLASHQRQYGHSGRESVRGANADRGRNLPATGSQRPRLPDHVL